MQTLEELKKIAAEHPEMRKKIVPFIKQALVKPEVNVDVKRDGIVFNFTWRLPNIGSVDEFPIHVRNATFLLDSVVEGIRKEFSGTTKKDQDDLIWLWTSKGVYLTGRLMPNVGVFGIPVAEHVERLGGRKSFETVLKGLFKGWNVVSLNWT
jgi:hypothetical protein